VGKTKAVLLREAVGNFGRGREQERFENLHENLKSSSRVGNGSMKPRRPRTTSSAANHSMSQEQRRSSMIPTMALFIGFYVVTRMIEILNSPSKGTVTYVFAVVTIIVTALCVSLMLGAGASTAIPRM
jgi:hypothetical protein